MTTSATGYALLGLLSIRPWTTYELAAQLDRSLSWFWPRASRQVYDEARRLAKRDLADRHTEMTGRRAATVYTINDAGREALAEWLGEPSEAMRLESEGLVRVFFADAAGVDELRSTLGQLAADADVRLETLATMGRAMEDQAYGFPERRHVNALALRFQLDHQRTIASWATWALDAVDEWTSSSDPGTWDWRTAIEAGGETLSPGNATSHP